MRKILLTILTISCVMIAVGGGSLAHFSDTETSQGNVFTAGVWVTHIEAGIEIKPETLNLSSQGVFTAFITLPEGFDLEDILLHTVQCEGAFAIRGHVAGWKFVAKFYREDLVGVPTGDEVVFTVTGELFNGISFTGSDIIRVIDECYDHDQCYDHHEGYEDDEGYDHSENN